MKTTMSLNIFAAAVLLAALGGPAAATEAPASLAETLCRPVVATDGPTVHAICIDGALAALAAPAPDGLATAQPWRPRPVPRPQREHLTARR